ncbi:MAG: hypothetical protein WC474_04730 [Hydrogenophilaceae bacterium]
MKRKAMIVSMAVATGFPGWAMAKGAKAPGDERPSAAGVQAHGLVKADQDLQPVPAYPDESSVEVRNNTKELLARVKSTLMAATVPAAVDLRASQWKMEMMESSAMTGADDSDDPRLQQARPVGVAFRLRF